MSVTVPLSPVGADPVPCESAVTGLFWYLDGDYIETLETALLFEGGAVNPKLTTARLLGEICDGVVEWSAVWENEAGGDDGAPMVYPLGADLDVVAAADTIAGLLTVRATFGGQTFGPIDLLLLPGCGPCYSVESGSALGLQLDALTWETGATLLSLSATGPWVHTAGLIGQWPTGTVFNWSYSWTGAGGELITQTIGPALSVYRPAGATSTGGWSGAVEAVTPLGESLWSSNIEFSVA